MKRLSLLMLVAIVLIANAHAVTDPFTGRWILNAERSKYPAGTCPKQMMIEMEPAGNGIHYRSEATYANGASARSEYTAEYNGKSAIVMGAHSMMLPVFLKRIDSRTVVASYTKTLKVVATSRRVISRDGQVMTITTVSTNDKGKLVTIVGVYDRVSAPAPVTTARQ